MTQALTVSDETHEKVRVIILKDKLKNSENFVKICVDIYNAKKRDTKGE